MEDLAMYILDVCYNSVRANAKLIVIKLILNSSANKLTIIVDDDGCGMSSDTLAKVSDPFYTSRTVRKVGLGLSLFKDLARQCNGNFVIESTEGVGTKISLELQKNHIDIPPIGNVGDSLMYLIQANPQTDYYFEYHDDKQQFIFDTKEVKIVLEDVSLDDPSILLWIKDSVNQGIKNIKEEVK